MGRDSKLPVASRQLPVVRKYVEERRHRIIYRIARFIAIKYLLATDN